MKSNKSSFWNNKSQANSMLDRVIKFALQRRVGVLLFAAALLLAGTWRTLSTPIDVFPDLDRPTVTVLVEAHNMAPVEVESLITIPIEGALLGSPGIENVRSSSNRGFAKIQAEFDWDMDIYKCRQIVNERLNSLSGRLPGEIQPELAPISSIMGEIMLIGLTPIYDESETSVEQKEAALMELQSFARWEIERRILSIPGVSRVTVIGGMHKQYQMMLKPDAFSGHDLSIQSIYQSLDAIGHNTGGGFSIQNNQEIMIRNIGAIYDPSELDQATVGYRAGVPLKFREIGAARIGAGVRRGDAGINGQAGVIIAVQKQPGISTLRLTENVMNVIEEIETTSSVEIAFHPNLFQQKHFIERAIENIFEAIRDGSIIIIAILFVFLWNFRTTLITLIALPLSLLSALIILTFMGLELNTMTLGGFTIAIGELVDDAIVDVENVFRRLRENRLLPNPEPTINVVYSASSEIRNSIVLATLIVVLVFLPLLFLPGLEGRMFQPLALAYIIALVSSLVIALTVTPVLAYYLLSGKKSIMQESFISRKLKSIHGRNLTYLISHPWISVGGVAVLMLGVAILLPRLDRTFLPEFNEGTLTVEVFMPIDAALTASSEVGARIERSLITIPGVESVARRTGRAEGDEHAEGVHYSEFDVSIDTETESLSRTGIESAVRTKMDEFDQVFYNIGQPISHRIDHMLTGVRADAAVILYGPDLAELQYGVHLIRQSLIDVEGVVDLRAETSPEAPEIKIALYHDALSRYGISPAEATRNLDILLAGEKVGFVQEGNRFFDIILKLDGDRRSIDALNSIILKHLPSGQPVTVDMIADVYETRGPYEIKRTNGSRRMGVQFNIDGRASTDVMAEVRSIVAAKTDELNGMRFEISGRLKEGEDANKKVLMLATISVVLIGLSLYFSYRSLLIALQILINIPIAFIGAILGLWITNTPLSIATMVGLIALTGIASRNGILMISHMNHIIESEGRAFNMETVIHGALERLIPVLMTASTAALALLPILITGSEAPGKEILFPVAVVITGGLISSTAIDLGLTPVLYYHIRKRHRKEMNS